LALAGVRDAEEEETAYSSSHFAEWTTFPLNEESPSRSGHAGLLSMPLALIRMSAVSSKVLEVSRS